MNSARLSREMLPLVFLVLFLSVLPMSLVPCYAQTTARTPNQPMYHATATGGLTSPVVRERVEVSRRNEALFLRAFLSKSKEPVEVSLPGSFLHGQDFKAFGLHVLDLNGDGLDEIVVITSDGASVGSYLSFFGVRDGQLKRLTDHQAGGNEFAFEQMSNGHYRVKCYGKWTDESSSTLQAYEWDGQTLKRRIIEGPDKRARRAQ